MIVAGRDEPDDASLRAVSRRPRHMGKEAIRPEYMINGQI
jgi:hypothetical protein